MPWDNVLLDGLAVVAALSLYGLYARWQHRRTVRPAPPEPLRHVRLVDDHNIDGGGRVLKVGIDCHARTCVDDEGRVTCLCGKSDLDREVVA